MRRDSAGMWTVECPILPGIYQYKFVVDGTTYENDPRNPVTVANYNNSGTNSVFVLTEDGTIRLSADPTIPASNPHDEYQPAPDRKAVYLTIVWHQHQPLYVDPGADQLTGPWVRTHATKDYYDMAAMLREYPEIHCTINLTSSLLYQLREFYINRLGPYVDVSAHRIDVDGFLAAWRGKTDPWIDLALTPASSFTSRDKDYLYRNAWNAFGMSEVMMARYPEYRALKERLPATGAAPDTLFTEQELREIKFWFMLAYFDPDFLRGPVRLVDGTVCDLSGFVQETERGEFRLRRRITERDCRAIVVDAYAVMANVIPIHRALRYDREKRSGSVEIITTPFYHPILPLITDSDLARTCQPNDAMPDRFSYPQDADAQVAKAVSFYTTLFGAPPTGMWPAEGAVAQEVLPIFRRNGLVWTASDVAVLRRSDPPSMANTTPYRFPAGSDASMALVFRDTELSDRIGFKYQNYEGEPAAEDFVRTILSRAPRRDEPDVLVTVILDGENAWEWYRKDVDGKDFLHALYRKLSRLGEEGRVITTTTTEYIDGNEARGIAPHPVAGLPGMHRLWPGSWINGNFDTWIGEKEENQAWDYLVLARRDLDSSGLRPPDPRQAPPSAGTREWNAWKAWEEMYAAEGSDWFWWYGDDQTAPAGDAPFDQAFITHLQNVTRFARAAGGRMPEREFRPILAPGPGSAGGVPGTRGTMAQSHPATITVLLECDASRQAVSKAIYVAGNLPVIGDWRPNSITMYDDGTHGDRIAADRVWSLLVDVPPGFTLHYKYTNSGSPGAWTPGEEFAGRNRTLHAPETATGTLIIKDIFGH